ncbi:MAG: elongation factor Ts [Erysipelotrichaceae bacterium]|nr:elongation factor Ts [Erysipelotrichaceae bacterium]
MAAITAGLVKELREKTGAGMMDCKKALSECDGDINAATDWLREKGIAKAAKKASRIAAEGLTKIVVEGNTAVMFEVNSETDFVAKNQQFLDLLTEIGTVLLANKPATVEEALASTNAAGATLESILVDATATIGEKISFRRFEIFTKNDDQSFGAYMHMGGKISCVTVISANNDEVAKDVSMHAAAMAPQFINRTYVPAEFIEHERSIQIEMAKNDTALANKPEKVLAGIIEGRLSKMLKEICLEDQPFFKNPDVTVGQYVKNANASIVTCVRYAVGEGIEKRQDNFAEEVMSQVR